MSIPMNSQCLSCRVNRILNTVRPLGTEEQTTEFIKRWMGQAATYPKEISSATCGYHTDRLAEEFYGICLADLMKEEREQSNRFVMERLDHIRNRVSGVEDPIFGALQYAILGNYLDFAALQGRVSFAELDAMLDKAKEIQLDGEIVARFKADLHKGKKVLLITDNAGEIGFDRILAETLQQEYPHLEITFCVRGRPVANDATREDAQAVGISFPIIDSGCAVGGTDIALLGDAAKKALKEADVVIAKGMGNTESMYGCGYNVYYAFLVKCQRFADFFKAPMMQAMFIRDQKS